MIKYQSINNKFEVNVIKFDGTNLEQVIEFINSITKKKDSCSYNCLHKKDLIFKNFGDIKLPQVTTELDVSLENGDYLVEFKGSNDFRYLVYKKIDFERNYKLQI